MISSILYQNSSNALMDARNCQSQVSQKEFEIKMMDINNRYSSYETFNSNMMRRRFIESDIMRLKDQMERSINNAIESALDLAYQDIQQNNPYSMSAIAISSIYSFLHSHNIKFKPTITVQWKMSQLSGILLQAGSMWFNINCEVNKLKSICGII